MIWGSVICLPSSGGTWNHSSIQQQVKGSLLSDMFKLNQKVKNEAEVELGKEDNCFNISASAERAAANKSEIQVLVLTLCKYKCTSDYERAIFSCRNIQNSRYLN